ncbi:MAG: hypothetical protein IJ723_02200 [Ruminococcus sp.]|nr:hypothetical protein [Ruminococcus sp.]
MTKKKLKLYRYCRHRIAIGKGNENDLATVEEVESFIAAIRGVDIVTHDIIAARYLDGCSWAKVASITNSTPDACRVAADRYIFKSQKN